MVQKQHISHAAFSWLGQPPKALKVYDASFPIEIMGESPYLNARDTGTAFALTAEHVIKTVFLYAQGVEGFSQYAGALPADLTFSSSRKDVRIALGEAVLSGETGGSGFMAIDFGFDRYEQDKFYVRFEYAHDDSALRLVTIGFCET
jgi:hypothetical protein